MFSEPIARVAFDYFALDILSENVEARGGASEDAATSDETFVAKIVDKRTNLDFCNGFIKARLLVSVDTVRRKSKRKSKH